MLVSAATPTISHGQDFVLSWWLCSAGVHARWHRLRHRQHRVVHPEVQAAPDHRRAAGAPRHHHPQLRQEQRGPLPLPRAAQGEPCSCTFVLCSAVRLLWQLAGGRDPAVTVAGMPSWDSYLIDTRPSGALPIQSASWHAMPGYNHNTWFCRCSQRARTSSQCDQQAMCTAMRWACHAVTETTNSVALPYRSFSKKDKCQAMSCCCHTGASGAEHQATLLEGPAHRRAIHSERHHTLAGRHTAQLCRSHGLQSPMHSQARQRCSLGQVL